MMEKGTNTYQCKKCRKTFYYSEESFSLRASKGYTRPERCPTCRENRKKELNQVKKFYFPNTPITSEKKMFSSKKGFTFHGNRTRKEKPLSVNIDEKQTGITQEDILDFYGKLENNQVVIVSSPTGSGKSTKIPFYLLTSSKNYQGDIVKRILNQGQIVITQPLTSAVQRIPNRIANDFLGTEIGPGQIIGLRHGSKKNGQNGDKYDNWNLEVVVTDGSLRNWIRDGKLSQYSLIMIDEAHQRSCNIETILMLLKNELPKYPNLKVVISSATINQETFLKAFQDFGIKTDILEISFKNPFKYYVHFWQKESPTEDCDC